jgi:hypothetical protein
LENFYSQPDGDDWILGNAFFKYAGLYSIRKSQREQVIGQTVALPTTMVIFAAMGILITSAAVVVFPQMKPDELWIR